MYINIYIYGIVSSLLTTQFTRPNYRPVYCIDINIILYRCYHHHHISRDQVRWCVHIEESIIISRNVNVFITVKWKQKTSIHCYGIWLKNKITKLLRCPMWIIFFFLVSGTFLLSWVIIVLLSALKNVRLHAQGSLKRNFVAVISSHNFRKLNYPTILYEVSKIDRTHCWSGWSCWILVT